MIGRETKTGTHYVVEWILGYPNPENELDLLHKVWQEGQYKFSWQLKVNRRVVP